MTDLRIKADDRPGICAHRGGMVEVPENTCIALSHAAQAGATAAEIDIRLSADETLFLLHDARVDRTTSGTGLQRELRDAEIKKLNAAHRWAELPFEPIPSFDDALSRAEALGLTLRVELKENDRNTTILEAVAAALERYTDRTGNEPALVFTSFDHVQLHELKVRMPRVATMGILPVRTRALSEVIDASSLDGISVQSTMFTESDAKRAHAAGAAISCFVPLPADPNRLAVEELNLYFRIADWYERSVVDMLTTDDVGRFRTALRTATGSTVF